MQQPSDILMVLGDGPSLPSGLARIARELCAQIYRRTAAEDDWPGTWQGMELIQLGLNEPVWGPLDHPWTVIPVRNQDDWGGADVVEVLKRKRFSGKKITLLTVFDPARCVEILDQFERAGELTAQLVLAGYFAIDAQGVYPEGGFGGPAAAALDAYDYVAAYTEFGARVLRASAELKEVAVLPHGIEDHWFAPTEPTAEESLRAHNPHVAEWLDLELPAVGCVAANQPRKDLGLFFRAVAKVNEKSKPPIKIWLHTDYAITAAWSIPELIAAYCNKLGSSRVLVTASRGWSAWKAPAIALPYTDEELKVLYHTCALTVAPGLGEGWGYPIVESQACGVPCVGIHYGGGADLADHTLLPHAYRIEGAYLLYRPVVSATVLAVKVLANMDTLLPVSRLEAGARAQAAARRWRWPVIWPQWEAWLKTITGRGEENLSGS